MNNAASVASQRFAGSLLSCARWPAPGQILRYVRHVSTSRLSCRLPSIAPRNLGVSYRTQQRHFCQLPLSSFQHSPVSRAVRAKKARETKSEEEKEKGLAFRAEDLSAKELTHIFGPRYPRISVANHLLRILHGRRNDGTLDLPLPPDVQKTSKEYPTAVASGLRWLRANYPIDEDAAIMARLQREEFGEDYSPSKLEQRGQDVGLYGPQSGYYHAPLSQSGREGDVWGRSELDEIRAENEAKALREEEELQAEIDQKMAEEQLKRDERRKSLQLQQAQANQDNGSAITALPEQGVSTDVKALRPPNEYEKWIIRHKKEATSGLELESPEVAQMSFARRVLPSTFFVALVCIGCYLYAQYWTPPRRADRRYPDLPLTYATIWGLALVNLAVFSAWRFPPAWKYLNKFFILTPGYPRVLSMLGCTISHEGKMHFFNNMLGLAIIGSALHEEVGRGTFLAIYIGGGAVGSLVNLLWHSSRGLFITSSLGASGSVSAIIAALCWLNADKKFTLVFLPESWRGDWGIEGGVLTAAILAYEVVMLIMRPLGKIDHVGHLGGMLVGLVSAQEMRDRRKIEERQGKESKGGWGFQTLVADLRDSYLGSGKNNQPKDRDMGRE